MENEAESAKSVTLKCIKISQPVGDFFVGGIKSEDLCEIASFDVRRVLQEQRDVERYLGIQRPLNDKRVAELKRYVRFIDATFPTSIILRVSGECAVFDEQKSELTLVNIVKSTHQASTLYRNIARVIDGQHRIAGLFGYDGPTFELPVTILVGFDIATQAQIFSTVNLEQTKVNKSLAYDLFALAEARSPQKSCHNVAVALDQDENAPFFQRIKRLGVATEGRYAETITQATFVEALQLYLSRDPKGDRDVLLRKKKLEKVGAEELNRVPLRNLFIEEEDVKIANIMKNYFLAVYKRWPEAWDFRGRGRMLNKTNGFRALMRVFGDSYLHCGAPGDVVSVDAFHSLFLQVNLNDDDFTVENFPPGTAGESALTRLFFEQMGVR